MAWPRLGLVIQILFMCTLKWSYLLILTFYVLLLQSTWLLPPDSTVLWAFLATWHVEGVSRRMVDVNYPIVRKSQIRYTNAHKKIKFLALTMKRGATYMPTFLQKRLNIRKCDLQSGKYGSRCARGWWHKVNCCKQCWFFSFGSSICAFGQG